MKLPSKNDTVFNVNNIVFRIFHFRKKIKIAEMGSTDRFLAKVRSIAEKYLKSGSVSVIFHIIMKVKCRYLPLFFQNSYQRPRFIGATKPQV